MSSVVKIALKTLQTISSSVLNVAAGPKRVTLLVTGLDNSGKTTLLHCMRNYNHCRAFGPGISAASFTDIHFSASDGTQLVINGIDLGGLQYRDHPGGIQQLWRDFLTEPNFGVDGIVFVVDASDAERFAEAGNLLQDLLRVLQDFEMEGGGVVDGKCSNLMPVLVLGNKIDAHGAVSEEDLRGELGLPLPVERGDGQDWETARPVEMFMCSVVMGQGYQDGFEWLARQF